MVTVYKHKCVRCGYKWDSEIERPAACAKCHRHNWWKKAVVRVKIEPKKCGICGKMFKPKRSARQFCSLACGAARGNQAYADRAAELRRRGIPIPG